MITQLIEALDSHFKFNVGDLVYERTMLFSFLAELRLNGRRRTSFDGRTGVPVAMIIGTRRLEQCHGGIQGFYACHTKDGGGRPILQILPDHALVAAAEVEAVAAEMAYVRKPGE